VTKEQRKLLAELDVLDAAAVAASGEERGPAFELWRSFKERSDVAEALGERFRELQAAGKAPL